MVMNISKEPGTFVFKVYLNPEDWDNFFFRKVYNHVPGYEMASEPQKVQHQQVSHFEHTATSDRVRAHILKLWRKLL
jgi:hypothetical protein